VSEPSLRECVLAAASAVEASRDELSRLDSAAGDGDHGVTMTLAARAVRKTLDDAPDISGELLVTRLALAMGSVGGAIGPIYATGLLAIAASIRSRSRSEPLDGSPTVEQLVVCAAAAEGAIAALGGAKPGDKTILDALDPAVSSLRRAGESGRHVAEALRDAARSAREGATASAAMVAAVGRASRLAERSRGSADPGASSLALILEAMAEAYGA
jgi:phosphoenolpyruvate---glycerone phosphotransferase subunit DhaL